MLLLVAVSLMFKGFSQNQTFITVDNNDKLHKVNIANCTDKVLNFCTNFTGSNLSIALDGNILYIVDNKGYLYSNTLDTLTGTTATCTKLGQFISKSTSIYGLTVGPGGIVYAGSGTIIETYNPTTNTFKTLAGNIPSQYTIGGDLLFWQGNLYEAVKNGSVNSLLKINLTNLSASTNYLTFTAPSVYGIASVEVPCSENKLYAFSDNTSSTDVYELDMVNKVQITTKTCTFPYKVYDAASIAETQSGTPPNSPTVVTPINYCQGDPVSALSASVTSTLDTLRWWTASSGGSPTGKPVPNVSSLSTGTFKWYVSAFDTSTKCESGRLLITVNVNAYPAVPTVNPSGTNTICNGNSLLLNSSAASGNQWYFNGAPIASATGTTYSATATGDYTVTTTNVNGCSKTSTPTTINVTNATINYPGSPFCPKGTQAVTLTGATGGQFTATPAGLNIDATTGLLDLSKSLTGNYTITYTVGPANCQFTTNIAINSISAAISYSPNAICQANSPVAATLASGSTAGGTFTAVPAGLTINSNTGTITASSSTAGNYTVTYTYGTAGVACGLLTTTSTVTINAPSASTIPAKICNGNKYTFNGVDYTVTGKYPVHFTNAVGCDSTATLDLTVYNPTSGGTINKSVCTPNLPFVWNGISYSTAGTYPFHLTNADGCDSTITLNLTIPTISIDSIKTTPENPVSAGTSIVAQVISASSIDSAKWLPSSLFSNTQTTQTFNALNDTFRISVTAYNSGCTDTASKLIVVTKNSNFIPNAIAPSNSSDPRISHFMVYGTSIKTADLTIFNQWGQKIFHSDDAKYSSGKGWDGTFNGTAQPTGVYVYVVKITYLNNVTETKSGSVNLIR